MTGDRSRATAASAYRPDAGMISRLAGGPPERTAVIRWTPCLV